jgi:hypothetical protein
VNTLRKQRKLLKVKQTETYGGTLVTSHHSPPPPHSRLCVAAEVGRLGPKPASAAAKVPLRYERRVKRWTLPFMGSDASVVRNSQYSMWQLDKLAGQHRAGPGRAGSGDVWRAAVACTHKHLMMDCTIQTGVKNSTYPHCTSTPHILLEPTRSGARLTRRFFSFIRCRCALLLPLQPVLGTDGCAHGILHTTAAAQMIAA